MYYFPSDFIAQECQLPHVLRDSRESLITILRRLMHKKLSNKKRRKKNQKKNLNLKRVKWKTLQLHNRRASTRLCIYWEQIDRKSRNSPILTTGLNIFHLQRRRIFKAWEYVQTGEDPLLQLKSIHSIIHLYSGSLESLKRETKYLMERDTLYFRLEIISHAPIMIVQKDKVLESRNTWLLRQN